MVRGIAAQHTYCVRVRLGEASLVGELHIARDVRRGKDVGRAAEPRVARRRLGIEDVVVDEGVVAVDVAAVRLDEAAVLAVDGANRRRAPSSGSAGDDVEAGERAMQTPVGNGNVLVPPEQR